MPDNTAQAIPCPVCSTKIAIDVKLLLQGVQFTCSNCHATIGLSHNSKPLVENAIDKMEQLKTKIGEKK